MTMAWNGQRIITNERMISRVPQLPICIWELIAKYCTNNNIKYLCKYTKNVWTYSYKCWSCKEEAFVPVRLNVDCSCPLTLFCLRCCRDYIEILHKNFLNWMNRKKYKYKNNIYKNYIEFIKFYIEENNGEKCKKVLRECSLTKKQHKNTFSI